MHTHDARLAVRPWKRFGHDRLYVTDATGMQIGYWDNLTAAAVPDDETRAADIVEIVRAYWAIIRQTPVDAPQVTVPRQRSAPAQPQHAPQAQHEWTDLAARTAGAGIAAVSATPAPSRVVSVLARLTGRTPTADSWAVGAQGEQIVGRQLQKLDKRWHVLHSVPVGRRGSDIDHVLVGPAGVFTLNTKHHADARIVVRGNTFLVNNYAKRYVYVSRAEAENAAALLTQSVGIPVLSTGVIVVVGARGGFDVSQQPPDGDVVVLTVRTLVGWLAARPAVLDDRQVDAVFAKARRSDVWAPQQTTSS